MKTLAEQIATTYTAFTENADLQLTKSNKSAGLRARKLSLEIDALLKEFRHSSLTSQS
ncbi:MAG: histone H1 [Rikenellaceae bacterium]